MITFFVIIDVISLLRHLMLRHARERCRCFLHTVAAAPPLFTLCYCLYMLCHTLSAIRDAFVIITLTIAYGYFAFARSDA